MINKTQKFPEEIRFIGIKTEAPAEKQINVQRYLSGSQAIQ